MQFNTDNKCFCLCKQLSFSVRVFLQNHQSNKSSCLLSRSISSLLIDSRGLIEILTQKLFRSITSFIAIFKNPQVELRLKSNFFTLKYLTEMHGLKDKLLGILNSINGIDGCLDNVKDLFYQWRLEKTSFQFVPNQLIDLWLRNFSPFIYSKKSLTQNA